MWHAQIRDDVADQDPQAVGHLHWKGFGQELGIEEFPSSQHVAHGPGPRALGLSATLLETRPTRGYLMGVAKTVP